jgi:zinc resistance-associated protein
MMKRFPIALALAGALLSAAALSSRPANAEDPEADRPPMDDAGPSGHRVTPEDRQAFLDARIAAIHAGLQLSPDQEKLWLAAESAIRAAVAQMREARQKMREEAAGSDKQDPIARMRRGAERSMAVAQSLTKIADAAQPLYASLTEDQKWRLQAIIRAIHWGHDEGHRRLPEERDGD